MGKAALIELNGKKTVLVPLPIQDFETIRAWLLQSLPLLSEAQISLAAEYLGVQIGPEGHLLRWRKPSSRWRNKARMVKFVNQKGKRKARRPNNCHTPSDQANTAGL